ncbi:hypothetical protein HGA34_05740 [Candidatus Falkowbacteria bacterium]|nr:hypothetical protein [Candidatus Falkowbacteria bacterium]
MTQSIIEHKIEEALDSMPILQPNERLFGDVMLAIYRKQVLYFRLRLAAAISMVAVFGISAIFWGKAAVLEFASSEAWVLVKMLFSDYKAVISNWQIYSTYLVESLPVASAIWLMLGLFVSLLALKILIQELAHRPHRLAH